MSHRFFLVTLLVAACASSHSTPKIPDPDIDIAQIVGPAELSYPYGPIDLQFALQITNHWTQPMNLTRVNVSTLNPAGGAYSLRRDYYNVRATIAPGETQTAQFWAHAYGWGHSVARPSR